MHVSATTIFRIVFLITLSALTATPVAQAQVDHLQCHKVKDGQKFKGNVGDVRI